MNTLALTASRFSIGEAGIAAVLGYAVVFVGLILLMCVVVIMGKATAGSRERAKAAAAAKAPAAAAPATPVAPAEPAAPLAPPAPGSAGEVKLFDVPDKEAAMIMAIVADKMGKPLNELRFKSIKEVK